MRQKYDEDDVPVVNPHYRGADGRTTVAPQIYGGDNFRPSSSLPGYPACAGADPEVFYPQRGGSIDAAKRVCKGCPIRLHCREIHMDERFGVWGGLSERQRQIIRAQRRIATREFTYEDVDR